MLWAVVAAHVLLPGAIAAVAAFGAWRCWRLLRYASDPRLTKLAWFYALFAASSVAAAIWMGQVAFAVSDASSGIRGPFAVTHAGFVDGGRVDVFLVAHHVLMLASLLVATWAFSRGRRENALAATLGLAFFGLAVPLVLAVEATLTLHLAIRAVVNHRRRGTPPSWQVAAGFLLFFLGHLTYFVFYHPGAARNPLGDVFALLGIVLLVRLLPRPTE